MKVTMIATQGARGGIYQLGDELVYFRKPVKVSMRTDGVVLAKPTGGDFAIYSLAEDDSWEEQRTIDTGKDLVSTWVNSTGTFRLGPRTIIVPQITQLHQSYPNPFNPGVHLSIVPFDLGSDDGPTQRIRIVIYNLLGQQVRTLYDGESPMGKYELTWQGLNDYGIPVASGIYFVQMATESGYVVTKKVALIK